MIAPMPPSSRAPAEPQWLGAGLAALVGCAALGLTGVVLRDAFRGVSPAAAALADLVALPIGLAAFVLAWELARPGRLPRALQPFGRWMLAGMGVCLLLSGWMLGFRAGWTWVALSQILVGAVFILLRMPDRAQESGDRG